MEQMVRGVVVGGSGAASMGAANGYGSDDAIIPIASSAIYPQVWEERPTRARTKGGDRATADMPATLSATPVPILVVSDVHDQQGVPFRIIGERWKIADLWACPYADRVRVDPMRPDEGVIHHLINLSTDYHSLHLDAAEAEAWERAGWSGPR